MSKSEYLLIFTANDKQYLDEFSVLTEVRNALAVCAVPTEGLWVAVPDNDTSQLILDEEAKEAKAADA